VNLDLEHKAFGIYEQMSLSTADLLATVVTPIFSAHAGRFDRLRVNYPGTGLRVTPEPDAQALANDPIYLLPGTFDAPLSEVMVDGGPRRKVVRQ
jgi:hypothetical protein